MDIPIGEDTINIVQFNIRGLIKNFYNLQTFISTFKPDIVCLQETQVGPDSTLRYRRPIEFRGYNLYRKDCEPGKWGVAILVKEDIPQSLLNIKSSLEQISVKVFYKGKTMSLTSLYLLSFTIKELEILNRQLLHNKIILSDANAHHSLWGDQRICPRGRVLLEFIAANNLVSLNKDEPTFISSTTGNPSSIDVSIISPQLLLDADWFISLD